MSAEAGNGRSKAPYKYVCPQARVTTDVDHTAVFGREAAGPQMAVVSAGGDVSSQARAQIWSFLNTTSLRFSRKCQQQKRSMDGTRANGITDGGLASQSHITSSSNPTST